MSALTRTQKIILLILAVLDVAVIAGLAAIVVNATRHPAQALPASATPEPTQTPAATWTPTPTLTPRPTLIARPTNTPVPTRTPVPTVVPTETPTPTPIPPIVVRLEGADFDFLLPNRIPGWEWDAYVNYKSGDEYNTETSYAEPQFTAADDPVRQISGTTLKIETMRWLKFRTWVHQTVTVTVGSRVTFRIKAGAFSSLDTLIVKAGIDATGAGNCNSARWGNEMRINQTSGTVTLTSPTVVVAELPNPTPEEEEDEETTEVAPLGRVTVCFFAEPAYPHINNAAFFDQAELIVAPPR